MKRFVACLLCVAMLVALVGIFGATLGGAFADLAIGNSFDATALKTMFSPLLYRKLLIAFIVAMGFAVLDLRALLTTPEEEVETKRLPRNEPLAYAAMRFRRYLLPVFVLVYAGLALRYIGEVASIRHELVVFAPYIFAAFFLIARRPLDMTLQAMLFAILNSIIDGMRAFARSGSHS